MSTTGILGGDCASCPMNRFGSAQSGRGKACTEKRLICVLQENLTQPVIVKVSPTSLKPFFKYLLSLSLEAKPKLFWEVETEFSLEPIDGEPRPSLALHKSRALDQSTVERIVKLRERLLPTLPRFTAGNSDPAAGGAPA